MATVHKLNTEPSRDLQKAIIGHFWRKSEDLINVEDYVAYFYQYNITCRALYLGALETESMVILVKSHEDLIDIVDVLWGFADSNPNFTRSELRDSLGNHRLFKDQPITKVNNSISLILRLWLTILIQDARFAPASKTIEWDDTSRFQDFILQQFPGPRLQEPDHSFTVLESNFTAVNLLKLCGIRVAWVCQLEHHLEFDSSRRVLKVYSLAGCLQDHLNSSSILPESLASETLRSLSLLFPNWDLRTEKFLRKSNHNQMRDLYRFEYPYNTHLSEFYFWRDRLARIHSEFQSPGPSWRHLWSDRRNPLQWYTFWFAVAIFILTLVFGIMTTTLAFLQTIYTYQSLQLARAVAALPNNNL